MSFKEFLGLAIGDNKVINVLSYVGMAVTAFQLIFYNNGLVWNILSVMVFTIFILISPIARRIHSDEKEYKRGFENGYDKGYSNATTIQGLSRRIK